MELDLVWRILEILIPLAIGYFTGWARVKLFIHRLRNFVITLDDGIADDKVTVPEWDQMWADFIKLIGAVKKEGE